MKRRNTAQQVVPYTLRVYLEMGTCCAELRQYPGRWHPLLLVPKQHILSPNPGSGSDGCFAALSEILDEEGGTGVWGSGATRRDKVILHQNTLTEARAQQLAEIFNHWRFIACWADTNCLRLPTEEQEQELLQKGQEVLFKCVDEFLENYMHSRIARYAEYASDALEEVFSSLRPDLTRRIQKLVQRDVRVWVIMSKIKLPAIVVDLQRRMCENLG
ncbi:hypothetical protein PLEOSDRAFT_165485 [Pleurotus ostreatus PC15]|uniref:Uncharacterized protein n=1 Tax=Pleurotus ostreatus (strain PC15) TaxID=1137138 RepID=A0A067P750_PLEO1|nr:hypothetical protein PLEOSDRAFT_165485 [Pleurotus ostreatus PC15]